MKKSDVEYNKKRKQVLEEGDNINKHLSFQETFDYLTEKYGLDWAIVWEFEGENGYHRSGEEK